MGCLDSAIEIPDGTPHFARIGDHDVIERIARGGMGIVFKARQRSLNRLVAIKMLVGGQLADAEAVERFRAEAAAIARLRHPGIVSIHEVGRHEGHHWFSMDWVDGPSLAELLTEGPLEPRAAVECLVAVAEAVEHAHQQGVLHRDLKPSNIVLDLEGRPRVTDFGLTRRTGTDSEFTASGQVLGTPGYLPPEQAEGARGPAGPAADVYGLGATLYHLLTGRPPFEGPTLAATLKRVLHDEPVSPAQLNPRVNRDLATVCLKCLEKEAFRRYPTAAELAEELHRWLRHEPIRARPAGIIGRGTKWVRRQPIVAGALAAVLLIAALAAGLIISARQRQARLESEAAGRWQKILTETESFAERESLARGLSAWARLMRLYPQKPEPVRRVLDLLSSQIQILKFAEPYKARVPGRDAVWSSDGRWMATGTTNGRVYLFAGDQLAEAAVLRPHLRPIRSLNFSADGRNLLTASDDGTARWTKVPEGHGLFRWAARHGACLSPDGSFVLTLGAASNDFFETAQAWSTITGAAMGLPMPHTNGVTCGVISQDNTKAVTGDRRGTVRVFDARTGLLLRAWAAGKGPIAMMRLSRDGGRLVVQADERSARVWNPASGEPVSPSLDHPERVQSLELTPDGGELLTVSLDGMARLWSLRTGAVRLAIQHCGKIGAARVSPNGRMIAVLIDGQSNRLEGTNCAGLHLWDAATGQPAALPQIRGVSGKEMEFSPDGDRLFGYQDSGVMLLWDVHSNLPCPPDLAPSRAPMPAPAWVATVAEAVSRVSFTVAGAANTKAEDVWAVRDQLQSSPADDFYTRWGRWFFAGRGPATVSPRP